MALRFPEIRIHSCFLSFLFLVIGGCASSPRFYLLYQDRLTQTGLDKILAENPLPPGQNLRAVTLGQSGGVSHHVVQIREREIRHLHKNHDATVVMLRGRGYLVLEKDRIDLSAGDVIFIPRGAVHYFVNGYSEPSVALAVYSPPFDGKDTIPVKGP